MSDEGYFLEDLFTRSVSANGALGDVAIAESPAKPVTKSAGFADIVDRDGDGTIYDGTPWERPAPVVAHPYNKQRLDSSIHAWMIRNGIDPGSTHSKNNRGVKELPPMEVIADIAAEQKSHSGKPIDVDTERAYGVFRQSLVSQYQAIMQSGLKVHAWRGEGEPYKTSPELLWSPNSTVMRQRVEAEGRFYFFMTQNGFGSEGGAVHGASKHPLLEMSPCKTSDGEPMLYNDVFRVVHDAMAHLHGEYSFSTKGEFNAMLCHASTLPRESWPALFAETFAQNSVYELTKKFADQNTYVSKHVGIIDRELSRINKANHLITFDDLDLPLGAGRRIRRRFVLGSPEWMPSEGIGITKFWGKKPPTYGYGGEIIDRDRDGLIYDGTQYERPVAVASQANQPIDDRGRPIRITDIVTATTDSQFAALLADRVSDVNERSKLDSAVNSVRQLRGVRDNLGRVIKPGEFVEAALDPVAADNLRQRVSQSQAQALERLIEQASRLNAGSYATTSTLSVAEPMRAYQVENFESNFLDLYPGYSKTIDQAIGEQENTGLDFYFASKESHDDFVSNAGTPVYLGGQELFQRPSRNNWNSVAGIIQEGVPLFFQNSKTEHADFFNDLTSELIMDEAEYQKEMERDPIERGVASGLMTFRGESGLWWVRVRSMNDRTIDTLSKLAAMIPKESRGPLTIDIEPSGRWTGRRSIKTYFDESGLLKLHKEIGKACRQQLKKSSIGTKTD